MSEVINAKYITRETNHMEYQPGMEIVPGNIMEQVLEAREGYDETKYTAADVIRALSKDVLTPEDFAALLSPAAQPYVRTDGKACTAGDPQAFWQFHHDVYTVLHCQLLRKLLHLLRL